MSLSYFPRLEPVLSAALLDRLGPERQTDLISRICRIERLSPELVRLTADHLDSLCLRTGEEPAADPEGVSRAAEILNHTPRSVEKHVILSLEQSDGDLAEEIKKRMFVFEDIVLLDGKTVRALYGKADRKELLLAMKAVAEEAVLDHIYAQLDESEQEDLKRDLGSLGRVKISDVDRAQQKIVELLRIMEENGEVVIARPDELMPE